MKCSGLSGHDARGPDVVKAPAGGSQTELEAVAKGWEKMKPFLEGKTVKQVLVLPECLVSIAFA